MLWCNHSHTLISDKVLVGEGLPEKMQVNGLIKPNDSGNNSTKQKRRKHTEERNPAFSSCDSTAGDGPISSCHVQQRPTGTEINKTALIISGIFKIRINICTSCIHNVQGQGTCRIKGTALVCKS